MIADLMPSEDQAAVRDTIATLVAAEFPVSRLHDPANRAGGAEEARWDLLAGLGLFGMGVAEARGGAGFALPEEVTAARELGRGLVSPSVLATMAAAHIADGDLFEAIRDGRSKVAFANPLAPLSDFGGTAGVQIVDRGSADHVLLWDDTQAALFACPRNPEPRAALDDAVGIGRAELDLSRPVATSHGPSAARRIGLLFSASLAAIAEETTRLAVAYAKTREQFGQPIGAFQAIKHYCAEMARRAEAAVAQTLYATLDAATREDGDMFEMAAARLLAADAAAANARFCIQIHGGMGFTYEADAHFYLKRALLLARIGSSRRIEQMRIMASAGPA